MATSPHRVKFPHASASPPSPTMFTSAPLTSTHRQFWVYFDSERLLLECLQCYS